ncbi:glucose/galactose MFS transporter [Shewanella sp. JBTF-M18]|uniref:Glucose/galactose MFS transporter n=1 Tax=Shewanella insulae TaxID=2681496 RepID=A0A6L7HVL5_9GAMM|nr:sugar MFS transporter [Shewanella insulae]MXR67081.1 glucose/galactose MFS transporter [Shewanella insulae]
MATAPSPSVVTSQAGNKDHFGFALASLTTLFFMWGFITCLNDILIPHLKAVFNLNYAQAMLIQFCFFGAYFLVSVPAGALVKRLGYQKGIVVGLLTAALGCGLFYPAAVSATYGLFLAALFVLASGITVLQVAANPYVTALGPVETASSRLTLTQAFNSLGTTIAPAFGSLLILSVAAGASAEAEAEAVKLPYLLLCAMLVALALVFALLKLPHIDSQEESQPGEEVVSALSHRHLVLGAVGIFVYVGGEVAIGSFLVNFLGQASVAAMEEAEAAHYIAFYWGGAMVGRFIGAAVMQRVPAGKVLGFNAAMAALLVVIAMMSQGMLAMWAILAVGLFNSIMFPTIFSLALKNLGPATAQGSGILCLAIVGGAVVPLAQGLIADAAGLSISFLLPVLCYAYILFYGLKGAEPVEVKQ